MRLASLSLPVLVLAGCAAGAESTPPAAPPSSFNPMVSFAPLVKAVEPAVVNVYVTAKQTVNVPKEYQFWFGLPGQQERVQQGQGSGFVISPDGYILTNNHVAEGATDIKVKFQNGDDYNATVVGTDASFDVALLKIDAKKALPWVKLDTADDLQVGDWVLAMGNPLGLGHSVSAGIVSGEGRSISRDLLDDFIQTDASINPGNSGGPLVALNGTVVGMNTAIAAGANSVGFAIPSETLSSVVEQLRDHGKVDHGYLGVEMAPLTDAGHKQLGVDSGVLVTSVVQDGPAEAAGLKPGDVIVKVDDKPVADAHGLVRAIAGLPPGKDVKVTVQRDGKAKDLSVHLGTRPAPTDQEE